MQQIQREVSEKAPIVAQQRQQYAKLVCTSSSSFDMILHFFEKIMLSIQML
jgi:hypothetical protein